MTIRPRQVAIADASSDGMRGSESATARAGSRRSRTPCRTSASATIAGGVGGPQGVHAAWISFEVLLSNCAQQSQRCGAEPWCFNSDSRQQATTSGETSFFVPGYWPSVGKAWLMTLSHEAFSGGGADVVAVVSLGGVAPMGVVVAALQASTDADSATFDAIRRAAR